MGMDVLPVEGPADLKRFIQFPYSHYRDNAYWVAPLPSDEHVRLTPGKNPYFEHAEAAYFLAREGGKIVGRIAASVDRNYDSFQGERQATFGFFEATSANATALLLKAAEAWSRSKGAAIVRGPMSFTTNDECGLLVDGFDRRPVLLMPYNVPEYDGWISAAGFVKAKDLYSFHCPVPESLPPAYARVVTVARRQPGLTTRAINMRRFDEELGHVKEIYNSAWDKNWGFVPMTEHEIDHMAKQLKPAVVAELIRFAEIDGQVVAFALTVPDVNIAFAKIRGSLFPFGIFQLLWTLPRIREFRVMALGIRKDLRRKGIAPLLIAELAETTKRLGYRSCEIGWTLEDNDSVNDMAEAMGGVKASVYRIYERRLAP
jgi:GNAT superfamily N-acetyltransferase